MLILVFRQKLIEVKHLELNLDGKLVVNLAIGSHHQEFLVEVLGFEELRPVLKGIYPLVNGIGFGSEIKGQKRDVVFSKMHTFLH